MLHHSYSGFEYDPAKSKSNQQKHGIDFDQAQAIWRDPRQLRFMGDSSREPRYAMVGTAMEKIWYAVYTLRGSRIRLISVRRARQLETMAYENEDDQLGYR